MFSLVFLVCFNYECAFTGSSQVFKTKEECEFRALEVKNENPNKEIYFEHQCVVWGKA
jgi:hypothetical protein